VTPADVGTTGTEAILTAPADAVNIALGPLAELGKGLNKTLVSLAVIVGGGAGLYLASKYLSRKA
jgi:hypothetical protein